MKVRVMLKDPDGVFDSLIDAGLIDKLGQDIPGQENDMRVVDSFIHFGEYVEIEIDTARETARVVR